MHVAELNLPQVPFLARRVHIVPELKSWSLLSIAQLCDADCKATFMMCTHVWIHCNGACILTGEHDPEMHLWHVNIPTKPSPISVPPGMLALHDKCNEMIGLPKVANMVAFAHDAALFSPTLSTLAKALKSNFLINFPGLTIDMLCHHPPQSKAMMMGHLDQTCKGTWSTTQSQPVTDELMETDEPTKTDEYQDAFPTSEQPNEQTHVCYTLAMEITGQVYSDQTRCFIAPPNKGNQYLFVLYDYDSNSIHAELMKNKTANSILVTYKIVHKWLCTAGMKSMLQHLDNECSQILKDFMSEQGIDYQLVPPHVHWCNAAEYFFPPEIGN